MADERAWIHYKQITGIIDGLNNNIRHIVEVIDKLKSIKGEILDNAEFKANLKEIVDVDDNRTMEGIVEDYQRFQALRDWLVENNYI